MAFAQACSVYYIAAAVLHCLVPAVFPIASVQVGTRRPGQATQEAINSISTYYSVNFCFQVAGKIK